MVCVLDLFLKCEWDIWFTLNLDGEIGGMLPKMLVFKNCLGKNGF